MKKYKITLQIPITNIRQRWYYLKLKELVPYKGRHSLFILISSKVRKAQLQAWVSVAVDRKFGRHCVGVETLLLQVNRC